MSDATRLRTSIAAFLDACTVNEMAFDPQRGYATAAEAHEAGFEFWARYCELHRAIGREPPATPAQFIANAGGLI